MSRLLRYLILFALLLLSPTPVLALDPARSILQYKHSRWNWDSDVPAPIFAIDQGRDGHLWLGGGNGLYRFDAVRFEKVEVEGSSESHGSAMAVLAARNGDIWTWFARSGRFAVYREGALRLVPAPEIDGQVTRMVQSRDGAIWAGIGNIGRPLLRFLHGRWDRIGADWGLPHDQLYGMVAAADGSLWVSYINSVLRLAPGARRFQQVLATPAASGTLTADPAGRIWLSDKNGSRPITGPGGKGAPPALRFPYPTDPFPRRGRPMFDRDGNLWIATRADGLERVRVPDPAGAPSAAMAVAQIEHYRAVDGLTSDRAVRMFEDREGNIWAATSLGLDRFRPTNVAVEPALAKPAAYGDLLLGASDGSVYVSQSDAIYRIAPGGRPEPFMTRAGEAEALCEAPDGTIWIAFSDRIVATGKAPARVLTRPKAETGIYDCAVDGGGDLWVTASEDGMYRYRDGRWEPMFGPAGRNGFLPTKMIVDARRRPVVQWSRGTISWLDAMRRESIGFGSENPLVRAFLETSQGLLATGSFGIAQVQGGHARILPVARIPTLRGVEGLVQTPQGEIWGIRDQGIVRIMARELDRALSEPNFSPPTISLDFHQGLPDRPTGENGRGIVRGGDGRIWVATLAGTVWFDPALIVHNAMPPGVTVTALTVDGTRHRDPRSLTLAPGASSIEINYAALSLSVPELNQVRYRLEGVDRDWIDPGQRRQAFYTNLPPGRYRFQVIAANNDGVWNRTGATVEFDIPPTFLQSGWFVAVCVLLALAAAWGLFQLRLRQVARRIRRRLEERHSEREHIARELHDTLLQSVQGLVLRFQAVANNMSPRAPARRLLEDALDRADDVIGEARDSVRVLRNRDNPGDLQQLIGEMVAGALDPSMPVRIVVEGKPRAVHSLAAVEISRIGREALFNVARHAHARSVEIDVNFGTQQLSIRIRDDGTGIPEAVLAHGHAEGHFGLPGMRERAEKLGGQLSIASAVGTGTDVTLTIPARLAYVAEARKRLRWIHSPRFGTADSVGQ